MPTDQKNEIQLIDRAWSQDAEEVCKAYDTDPEQGLNVQDVQRRRKSFGRNRLKQTERRSALSILFRQFKSLVMLVLALGAVLSFAFQQWIDGTGILLAILINAVIGFFTELRAVRSMESLQEMDVKHATVRRDGTSEKVEASEVVPGDIVVLESGDVVAADIRVIESNRLQVNESALTGESVPVRKQTDSLAGDTPLAERSNMLFKGTAVTEGSGLGIAVSIGMQTELGGMASMVQEAESEEDPLKKRLDTLTTQLVRVIIAVAVLAAISGIIAGKEMFIMMETSIALFVAAVPEGLPIVATLALARGMHRMVKRNALVRRLSAVQTLGSTNVIFTDKTGTLTENQMTAVRYLVADREIDVSGEGLATEGEFNSKNSGVEPAEDASLTAALKVGILCNNASFDEDPPTGDPMEVALLAAGAKAGMQRDELLDDLPEERDVAFDPGRKMMATFHRSGNGFYEAVKGAPEEVLRHCSRILDSNGDTRPLNEEEREKWRQGNERLAGEGLRVLALAERNVDEAGAEPYDDLVFIGYVGLLDPPRDDVREAIDDCRRAGVKVVMVTGDQEPTAAAIAKQLGIGGDQPNVIRGNDLADPDQLDDAQRKHILESSIFCRVSPEQKLRLIEYHQNAGSIVAMTGDGVNDAPALKKADIGIAMGLRGEPVAEDAADILLQDDRFATINTAIEYGRIIFGNIRKFVLYMISGNAGEIVIVVLASLAGAPLPLLPLQILYINVINDIFPSLALGVGPGSGAVMETPPRDPSEPIMTRPAWVQVGVYGLLIGLSVLLGFFLALHVFDMETGRAVTVSFLAVAFGRLWHVFNMRDAGSGLFFNQVTRNPWVWGALALSAGLLLLAVYMPPLAMALDVVKPGRIGWILILAVSLLPLGIGQVCQWTADHFRR